MRITRSTPIPHLDIRIRTAARLADDAGCELVGEALDMGPDLARTIGARAFADFTRALPARLRVRLLDHLPLRPPRLPQAGGVRAPTVRVWCTACGHVARRRVEHASSQCTSCEQVGTVVHRERGRPADAA